MIHSSMEKLNRNARKFFHEKILYFIAESVVFKEFSTKNCDFHTVEENLLNHGKPEID